MDQRKIHVAVRGHRCLASRRKLRFLGASDGLEGA
jgi:hypothetical protein